MGRTDEKTFGKWRAVAALLGPVLTCALASPARGQQETTPNYVNDVQPIFTKYCTGCHNDEDREGDLSLESYASLGQGLATGPAILAGEPDSSRLLRVITGQAEPKMPPEDEPAPSDREIAVVRAWIAAGARRPDGSAGDRSRLIVPTIARQVDDLAPTVTALSASPTSAAIAIARFRRVEIYAAGSINADRPAQTWTDFPGKVNALSFSQSGDLLVTASGVTGLYGQADIFDFDTGEKLLSVIGHRDTLYDAELSPDGKLLATAGYDGRIVVWRVETGELVRTMDGHNGAIFDIEFDPTGAVLASASADETIKLWQVESGVRLDTLSQPTAQQYTVAFSPDGKFVVAGGADQRIRIWQFLSHSESRINPLRFTRFAHHGAVVGLRFAIGGQVLITAGADRQIRLWETDRFAESRLLIEQSAPINALSVNDQGDELLVGDMEGAVHSHGLSQVATSAPERRELVQATAEYDTSPTGIELLQVAEQEPNDRVSESQLIKLPARVKGVIHPTSVDADEDIDLYKFSSPANQKWIFQIKAARDESQLDSKIAILTATGQRIERVVLQAVRDSYFTFRGKNSTQISDFRLHNWEEMQLNEYLYAGGEVTRLWLYPRGPDSGFNVYPGQGDRYTYFGTSGVAHALNEPAYVVEPHAAGATLIPTGLPVFPIYYENDDDPWRELGADSRLEFTAPTAGNYLIQVRDVRGFGGEGYTYELTARQPKPSFEATIAFEDGTISPGSGKEFAVNLKRSDGFTGKVSIAIEGLPEGFLATTPIEVQADQIMALGTINVLPGAKQPPEGHEKQVRVIATANIEGKNLEKPVEWTTPMKLGEPPEVFVQVAKTLDEPVFDFQSHLTSPPGKPLELSIAPGQTISAVVRITRKAGFNTRVSFGKEGAGRNLPHGVYIDNIGLNGLLIVEDAMQREFSITADTWVPETTRLFHLRTEEQGNQTSWPILLQIRK